MVRAVEANQIDIALVTLPAAGRMLDVRPVLDDEFVLVAPTRDEAAARDHRGGARTAAARPRRHELVVREHAPHRSTNGRCARAWALKPIMELGSVEAMKELTGAGLGCSVLPRMAVRGKNSAFVVRSLKPRLYRTLALVLRRDKPLSKGLRGSRGERSRR